MTQNQTAAPPNPAAFSSSPDVLPEGGKLWEKVAQAPVLVLSSTMV